MEFCYYLLFYDFFYSWATSVLLFPPSSVLFMIVAPREKNNGDRFSCKSLFSSLSFFSFFYRTFSSFSSTFFFFFFFFPFIFPHPSTFFFFSSFFTLFLIFLGHSTSIVPLHCSFMAVSVYILMLPPPLPPSPSSLCVKFPVIFCPCFVLVGVRWSSYFTLTVALILRESHSSLQGTDGGKQGCTETSHTKQMMK